MKSFDLRSLSVCKVMLFGHILMFLHFLGHSRLSGTLQAVRQWGHFWKYSGFKVGGGLNLRANEYINSVLPLFPHPSSFPPNLTLYKLLNTSNKH